MYNKVNIMNLLIVISSKKLSKKNEALLNSIANVKKFTDKDLVLSLDGYLQKNASTAPMVLFFDISIEAIHQYIVSNFSFIKDSNIVLMKYTDENEPAWVDSLLNIRKDLKIISKFPKDAKSYSDFLSKLNSNIQLVKPAFGVFLVLLRKFLKLKCLS